MKDRQANKLQEPSRRTPTKASGHHSKVPPGPKVSVRYLLHNLDNEKYLLDLRFSKAGGGIGKMQVPRASVYALPQLVKDLSDAGALLPLDTQAAIQLVKQALLCEPTNGIIMVTRRGGWREGSFISRGWTGSTKAKTIRFGGGSEVDSVLGTKQGDFRSWLEGLREPCAASDFLPFGLGVAYGAPLLDIIGEDEGVIFNLHGESTGVKASPLGCCSPPSDARTNQTWQPMTSATEGSSNSAPLEMTWPSF